MSVETGTTPTVDRAGRAAVAGARKTLSVVLPNYNHARFLPIALDRLLSQTRPADEIIVIDDASTDDSVAIIERFAADHPTLRVIRNEKNLGVVRNVNRGLEMASGEYIFYASADDAINPTLFEKGLALLEAYPRAALFTATADLMDVEGRPLGPLASAVPLAAAGFISPAHARQILLRDDAWFTGTSTIWKRSRLLDIGGFPGELGAFADGYLARMLALTDGSCFSPEVLGTWRRVEGSYAWKSTGQEKTQKLIDAVNRLMMQPGSVFPPEYAARWSGRQLFGTRRFRLACARREAWSAGIIPWTAALVQEVVLSAWYFLTLRRADAIPVLRRRLGWALVPSGSAGKGVFEPGKAAGRDA